MDSMAEETVAAIQDSGIVDDFDLDAFLLSDFPFFDFDADLLPESCDAESGLSPTPDQSDALAPAAPAHAPASPDSDSSFASYIEKFLMEDVDWSGAEEGLGEDAASDFFSGISLAGSAAPKSDAVNAQACDAVTPDGKKVPAAVGVEDDDDDFTSNKRRRQMRNRESAMMSRERKKMYIRDLELKNKNLSTERRRLEHALRRCVEENGELRRNLQTSVPCAVAMAKQESAVLFVESLLLGSLFWFVSLACFYLAPGLPIPNQKAVSRSETDHATAVSGTVSSKSVKLGRCLKLEPLSSRRCWRGMRGRMKPVYAVLS